MLVKKLIICGLVLMPLYSFSSGYDPELSKCHVKAYYENGFKWDYKKHIKKKVEDPNRYINWSKLYYTGSLYTKLQINPGDDFLRKGSDLVDNIKKTFRQNVYQDLLKINIDYELSFHTFIYEKGVLYQNLIRKIYDESYFNFISDRAGSVLTKYKMPFTGEKGLIKMILMSQHYYKDKLLEVITSPYQSNHYEKLVINMRGIEFNPSLFPRIYSYDKNNNKVLIYSVKQSNWKDIVKNGYAHYYSENCNPKLYKNPLYYSVSGINSLGDHKNDIVINREDYLKFFSSETGIEHLRNGGLYIIMDHTKL